MVCNTPEYYFQPTTHLTGCHTTVFFSFVRIVHTQTSTGLPLPHSRPSHAAETEIVFLQMGFLHKQPLAKNGMAATLALLRPSGVLADKVCAVCLVSHLLWTPV